ncbi:uncharacterized protein LOC124112083 isoform X2 [Haliotis rufescens]|uniref:uncharacterized protein LOC124112083 isoform X2 n=1 Tax=Haliotis rufescens TaxID=6454 RepID=UPI00201EA0A5|nr:uncharacterized protein LOC124112083 isoform X2 [Haliotis rufescens]
MPCTSSGPHTSYKSLDGGIQLHGQGTAVLAPEGHQSEPTEDAMAGTRGMRWKELDTILDAQVKATRRSPRALIIHLGSNDLCSVKGSQLYLDMVASILRIQLQLPDTKIIVSSMLPRRYWHDARDPLKIEGMRKNINRRLANRVKELGGTMVPHPQILASDKTWYAWEGVHLSDKGLCVFTDNVLHALALVLRQ